MKIFLSLAVISLNFYQYGCLQAAVNYDCNHPQLNFDVGMNPIKNIPGFSQKKLNLVYDDQNNRTLFISALLQYRRTHWSWLSKDNCKLDKNVDVNSTDVAGHLLTKQLGGSCNYMNLFPLNKICYKDLWLKYQKSVVKKLKTHGQVRYCVKLVYAKKGDRKPQKIISGAFSDPQNIKLCSIAIQNPLKGNCSEIPHLI